MQTILSSKHSVCLERTCCICIVEHNQHKLDVAFSYSPIVNLLSWQKHVLFSFLIVTDEDKEGSADSNKKNSQNIYGEYHVSLDNG